MKIMQVLLGRGRAGHENLRLGCQVGVQEAVFDVQAGGQWSSRRCVCAACSKDLTAACRPTGFAQQMVRARVE
ncbi:hypothetical protein ACFYZ9_38605 [Streptomyces sp. NPDC001691]|uniref:hypothetical protein n=1 Tax=Streptomyces sp. NPDC001691 TaxID=3364600 RepID=UPI00368EBBC1